MRLAILGGVGFRVPLVFATRRALALPPLHPLVGTMRFARQILTGDLRAPELAAPYRTA